MMELDWLLWPESIPDVFLLQEVMKTGDSSTAHALAAELKKLGVEYYVVFKERQNLEGDAPEGLASKRLNVLQPLLLWVVILTPTPSLKIIASANFHLFGVGLIRTACAFETTTDMKDRGRILRLKNSKSA